MRIVAKIGTSSVTTASGEIDTTMVQSLCDQVAQLRVAGHEVIVETNAGIGSGFTNDDYIAAGAKIIDTAAEVYAQADMI
ncbi:MAG: hypothetical protein EB130_06370, partial [Actinobacteria bacterium]|nr:hypothetical protein [Actinomycetota bacterium]